MSRKTKRHKNNTESQNLQMSPVSEMTSDISSSAKQGLDSVIGTVNNNKLLIGSIAGACGAAIFVLATATGRRLRSGIQTRSVDLYDFMSDQVSNGWCRLRDLTQNMLSSESESESEGELSEVSHTRSTKRSRRVA
jgi:hypothetical protein